jgi:RHS repeat-associated protein
LEEVLKLFFGGGLLAQATDYYPFGKSFENNNVPKNRYLYNGKELQDQVIGGTPFGWYDYGARFYDPEIGRFHTQDRFAEKYLSLTPYHYGANNPILNIDVNGDSLWVSSGNKDYYYGYTKENGYGFYGRNGEFYSGDDKSVKELSDALARLGLGESGKALRDFLSTSKENIGIKFTSGKNQAVISGTNLSIEWNPNSPTLIPTEDGGQKSRSFVSLGHEMAHIEDVINRTYNDDTWQTITDEETGKSYKIPNSELYSTHKENLIRSENGIPLRTYYGAYPDGSGNPQTRLIQGNKSLYIQMNNSTNYKKISNDLLRYKYR